MSFEDHYSSHAASYAQHRPQYPDALFAWLASVCPGHDIAWDAGTGSGQAAVAVASHFARVIATDASAEQLRHVIPHPRVEYRHEPAHLSSLAPRSVDLVTVASAAHWFDLDGFFGEVHRVAKQGAVIALFSYGPRDFADAIHPAVHTLQEEILKPFWPGRIRYVHERYVSLPFPFKEIEAPQHNVSVSWNLPEALAFFETWSASQKYFAVNGTRATSAIEPELRRAWGDPETRRDFACPLFMRVGRVVGGEAG